MRRDEGARSEWLAVRWRGGREREREEKRTSTRVNNKPSSMFSPPVFKPHCKHHQHQNKVSSCPIRALLPSVREDKARKRRGREEERSSEDEVEGERVRGWREG